MSPSVHVGYDIFLSTNGKKDVPKLIKKSPKWEHRVGYLEVGPAGIRSRNRWHLR